MEIHMDARERFLRIRGRNTIVEIDESAFQCRKYNQERGFATQWVFEVIARGSEEFIQRTVNRRDADKLRQLISQFI